MLRLALLVMMAKLDIACLLSVNLLGWYGALFSKILYTECSHGGHMYDLRYSPVECVYMQSIHRPTSKGYWAEN
jgi:hypothetical protein